MEVLAVTACSEFPNDNPSLHRGAIWMCPEVTGPAACEPPATLPAGEPKVTVTVPEPIVLAIDELVADLVGEGGTESVDDDESDDESDDENADEDEDEDTIEIVDELRFDEVVDESVVDECAELPRVAEDPWAQLAATLESIARDAGASDAAVGAIRVVLGRERVSAETGDELLVLREQAVAWMAVLRGESDDFSGCGATALDEWSALVLARAIGETGRADALRRELRRRGVAAFGIVVEAA